MQIITWTDKMYDVSASVVIIRFILCGENERRNSNPWRGSTYIYIAVACVWLIRNMQRYRKYGGMFHIFIAFSTGFSIRVMHDFYIECLYTSSQMTDIPSFIFSSSRNIRILAVKYTVSTEWVSSCDQSKLPAYANRQLFRTSILKSRSNDRFRDYF